MRGRYLIPLIAICVVTIAASCRYSDEDNSLENNIEREQELLKELGCSLFSHDSVYPKIALFNVTSSEFEVTHSRTALLNQIKDHLSDFNIKLDVKLIVNQDALSHINRRLIKINGLDSNIVYLPDNLINDINTILRTKRPIALLFDKERRMIAKGDVSKANFKQHLYNLLCNRKPTHLILRDSLIKVGDKSDTIFYIYNYGNDPLYIYDIDSSCDCSSVSIDKRIVQKGDSSCVFLKRQYMNRKTKSNLLIYSNDKSGIRQLWFE